MDEEIKSEFQVRVVKINEIVRHPNADTLSLINVDGYTVVSKTGSFKVGDYAVYVPVDALVPTARDEFKFLAREGKAMHRIKAARLRGIFSQGLLVPVAADTMGAWAMNADLCAVMGIEKYISPEDQRLESMAARQDHAKNSKKAGGLKLPVYGLDPFKRYSDTLQIGETVVVTEKLHGTNARYCFHKGRLWVGSHRMMRGASRFWLMEWLYQILLRIAYFLKLKRPASDMHREAGDVWWEIATKYNLREKLAKRPDCVLYGEIYGENVQKGFTYDSPVGRRFRAFDVYSLKEQRFLNHNEFQQFLEDVGLDPVGDAAPLIYSGPWNEETDRLAREFADKGKTELSAGLPSDAHMTEGVVIKPFMDREGRVGRIALKYKGEAFLEAGNT